MDLEELVELQEELVDLEDLEDLEELQEGPVREGSSGPSSRQPSPRQMFGGW